MIARTALLLCLVVSAAHANAPVQRSFTRVPSANGFTSILVDLPAAKVVHFREHLFATEEPLLDGSGNEVWVGNQPQVVKVRDLLYDAYFGLRANGSQKWLTGESVDLSQSGYLPWQDGAAAGTGIVTFRQTLGALELTSYAFAPRGLSQAGFVFALRVRNTGNVTATGVSAFSLHNFHLGFGRPGVMEEIGETGETVTIDKSNSRTDVLERAFAGVIVTRALGAASRVSAWNFASPQAENGWATVNAGGTADLPDRAAGTLATGDGWAHAFQFDFGDLPAGAEAWAGVAVAHHGDPFAGAQVQAALDAYVAGRGAQALVDSERAAWAALQARVEIPADASADEEALTRQSAVMLAMAQVQSAEAYLREHLTTDGEPRYTRFTAPDGRTATLPGTIRHKGYGAVLASLPPGEWTYAWIRDGAYAVAAMAELGLEAEAKTGLEFYLNAEAGRFRDWNELQGYGMPPYQITLTRYHGFGVEETDFNDFGPNLEFDGFGLFLWALRHYEQTTGDTSVTDSHWTVISERVADPIVALVDPTTGLLRKDSSIWESHWNGRERSWTYTNITAARGLCDAASLAERRGEMQRAATYRTTAERIRKGIAQWLTDEAGALASNLEELQSGRGYYDAAVVEAISMGLFDPSGRIARATLDALDANLRVSAGSGWARNDDRTDHAGAMDLSPWGSEYDSAEWVITDLRGAVALRHAGRTARADEILGWVLEQSKANSYAVAETYDETTAAWKFNAPMIGFGAGAWALALADRATGMPSPACGAYFKEAAPVTDAGVPVEDAGTTADAGTSEPPPPAPSGCGCGHVPGAALIATLAALVGVATRRRRAL